MAREPTPDRREHAWWPCAVDSRGPRSDREGVKLDQQRRAPKIVASCLLRLHLPSGRAEYPSNSTYSARIQIP
eukprot:scaffold313992_cov18-Prasinocladus_malaysianus.AAC.1